MTAPRLPESPRVLVAGLGAIGTTVAARLLASPRPPAALQILAPGPRAAAYRADPPALNGAPLGLPADAYVDAAPAKDAPRPDLLLVAAKAPALPELLPAIAAWTAPQTTVVSLLNGISAPRALAEAVSAENVLPAIVTCNSAVRNGRAVEQTGLFRIDIGARLAPAQRLPAPADVAAYLGAAPGIDAAAPDDFPSILWLKFVLNVGLNQTEALLGLDHAALLESPDALSFCRALMDEAAACAAAEGIPDALSLPARAEALFPSLSPHGRTSMLQDIDAGRTPETDLFADEVLRLAARHGLSAPVNRLVHDHLPPAAP